MTALVSVTPPGPMVSKGQTTHKRYNRYAAWRELALGKKPLWWRIAVWSQRRSTP